MGIKGKNINHIHKHRRKGDRAAGSWREDKRTAHERGYGHKWRVQAKRFLDAHPLCVICAKHSRTTAANTVDHIKPHKGDEKLFWDVDNWQALCKHCHDSEKQEVENKGYSRTIGADGWPVDPLHPVNTHGMKIKKYPTKPTT